MRLVYRSIQAQTTLRPFLIDQEDNHPGRILPLDQIHIHRRHS